MNRSVRIIFYGYLAAVFALAVYPLSQPVSTSNDKVDHALAFAAFMILGRLAHLRARTVWLLAVGLLYGLLIEAVQYFVPNRCCSAGDVIADVVGLAIGALLFHSFLRTPGRGHPWFIKLTARETT